MERGNRDGLGIRGYKQAKDILSQMNVLQYWLAHDAMGLEKGEVIQVTNQKFKQIAWSKWCRSHKRGRQRSYGRVYRGIFEVK